MIAPVTDNANIAYSTNSNSYNADDGTFTWGFGMSQSDVFDWFDAPDDWDDPTSIPNYGILTGTFNDANTGFDQMELIWHATDGQDSDSGVDDDGLFSRHLGVTVAPSDTVTVAALAAQGYQSMLVVILFLVVQVSIWTVMVKQMVSSILIGVIFLIP